MSEMDDPREGSEFEPGQGMRRDERRARRAGGPRQAGRLAAGRGEPRRAGRPGRGAAGRSGRIDPTEMVAACFDRDLTFAGGEEQIDSAFAWLRELRRRSRGWKTARRQIQLFLDQQNCPPEHARQEMIRARKYLKPWLPTQPRRRRREAVADRAPD